MKCEYNPYIQKNCLNYTRRHERHTRALIKRSHQAAYCLVRHALLLFRCTRLSWRVCGWSTGAHAASNVDIYGNKRVKTHILQLLLGIAQSAWARAIGIGIGIGEGRGPAWPSGPHHVDFGVWKAWGMCLLYHTRPTRGTRRELAV
jgi:hypothetical protein